MLDHLGTGSFGQVVKCIERGRRDCKERQVALKIIKNKPAYHNQGLVEVKLLEEVLQPTNESLNSLDQRVHKSGRLSSRFYLRLFRVQESSLSGV